MPEFLAVKRLTRSDLTFFEWHQKRIRAGNQKAINLNANVFETALYPAISSLSSSGAVNVKIALHVLGPGLAHELLLTRKILKGTDTYKNWRLDGEFIYDPVADPSRFHHLRPSDFVVLGFSGSAIAPDSVRADFIAASLPEDAGLHAAIDAALGGSSMRQLTGADLDRIIAVANPADDHPIHTVLLEMVAADDMPSLGGGPIAPAGRAPVSREQVERGKRLQAEIGYRGELLVSRHLERLRKSGRITDVEWSSDYRATGPYDFRITTAVGIRLIDVKSTSLGFDRSVHISAGELATMAAGKTPYDIYRVYGLAGSSAQLRVALDVGAFGATVLKGVRGLPAGVTLDSVSVSPASIKFDGAVVSLV